ncbi:MAG TPA: polyprenol monophosphomannose synthase [Polyangiaceae bacterium]|nr:polyprenol monophosphomannose synthase [Polyangiaceae bacterium]
MNAKLAIALETGPASEQRLRPMVRPRVVGEGTLIVVPTYDERDNLRRLLHEIFRHAPGVHVLVVDDNSPDGTGALADALARVDSRVFVRHRPAKLGLGSAYVEGFAWGLARGYQRFFEMDSDFSHDPAELSRFFDAFERGADVVVGSRNVRGGKILGWGWGRLALSKGGSAYSRAVLGIGVRDLTTGYKAYSRQALAGLGLSRVRSNGYSFQIETTFRALGAGFQVVEVPITFVDRRVGRSKMNGRIFCEAMAVVWRLRFETLYAKR